MIAHEISVQLCEASRASAQASVSRNLRDFVSIPTLCNVKNSVENLTTFYAALSLHPTFKIFFLQRIKLRVTPIPVPLERQYILWSVLLFFFVMSTFRRRQCDFTTRSMKKSIMATIFTIVCVPVAKSFSGHGFRASVSSIRALVDTERLSLSPRSGPHIAARRRGTNLGAQRGLRMEEDFVVTLKIALDANGAVDDMGMTAKRFTCAESLDAVHRLRRDSDAVLVGVGTVARDDPSLTVRRVELQDGERQPSRVVVDPQLRIPPSSVLLRDGFHTVIACSESSELPKDLYSALSLPTAAKVELFRLPPPGLKEGLQLKLLLNALAQRDIREIMVEGGPATARRFLQDGLVDRAIVIHAPVTFDQEPVPSNIDDETLQAAGLKKIAEHDRWGCDHVTLWAKANATWPTPDDVSSWP